MELLGQNVLRLEEPAGICELIASTIGVAEGKVDLEDLADDLKEAGSARLPRPSPGGRQRRCRSDQSAVHFSVRRLAIAERSSPRMLRRRLASSA